MGRRALVAMMTAAIFAATPAASLAAPPVRVTDTQTSVSCLLTGPDGTAGLDIGISAEFGEYAFLGFWADDASPFEEAPTWISAESAVTLSPDGSELTATFELYVLEGEGPFGPELGDFVGTAQLDATLTPSGPAEAFEESFRDGNRQIRISGTTQPLAVSGTLDLPEGISYTDLSECFAGHSSYTLFETNPNANVYRSDQISLSCSWETEDSFVSLFAITDQWGTFADLFVADASGTYFAFSEDSVLTASEFSASFVLSSEETGEEGGTAQASASLTAGDRFSFVDRFGGQIFKVQGVELLVDGLMTVETALGSRELPMTSESCFAEQVKVRNILTNPKTGGPRLSNDTPSGAVALEIGDAISVRTGGTAEPAEEPCIATDPEFGDYEVPLGRTAWYSVEGTGGPVTVDSAGSDYDTVLGVYTSDGSSFVQVACVDDVFEPDFSLQARVTIDTIAGVTYYIQAGGYGGQAGRLSLAVY